MVSNIERDELYGNVEKHCTAENGTIYSGEMKNILKIKLKYFSFCSPFRLPSGLLVKTERFGLFQSPCGPIVVQYS